MYTFGRKKMIFEKVVAILADQKDLDPKEITMESSFAELGFDSLDTVVLIMAFEEEFDITLEVSNDIKTIGDVVNLIEKEAQ